MAMDLLDGLETTVSFRLSRRAFKGAGAGPDAMAVGVVLVGFLSPVSPLPTLIRIAVACSSAGPDAMLVGGVSKGRSALISGAQYGLPVRGASPGCLAHWRATQELVGGGWRFAAMMPILIRASARIGHNIGLDSQIASAAAVAALCWQCMRAMKRRE